MKQIIIILALLPWSLFISCGKNPPPRAWEGVITIPTNDEYLENPVPQLADAEGKNAYPYALHKYIDYKLKQRVFRALFLENKYLKITVLPEFGGHVYSALDKRTGQEMFWANPELKKALIGITGAWCAFGLEFNFPVRGHTPTSLLPVNSRLSQDPEKGCASIILSDREYLGNMKWTAEIILRRHAARLETRLNLCNPTALPRPLYYWCNAAVAANESLQVVFPMPRSSTHGSPWIRPWPMENNLDLSWYKNHEGYMYSRFNRDDAENFMGYYDFGRDFGALHWADRDILPFRKFWSWGLSPVGRSWNKRLSNTGGEYIEIQAGLFKDQETMGFLMPRESLEFTEYWMPLNKCGGLTYGDTAIALGLRIDSLSSESRHRISYGFNAFNDIGKGILELRQGARILSSNEVRISPDRFYVFNCEEPPSKDPYTVVLTDENRKAILSFTENGYRTHDEHKIGELAYPESLDNPATAEEWNQAALKQEMLYNNGRALELLNKGLEKFPGSALLNASMGRMLLVLDQPEKALPFLGKGEHRHFSDPALDYLKGVALFECGRTEEAAHHLELALRLSYAPEACRHLLGLCSIKEENRAATADSAGPIPFPPRDEYPQWQYLVSDLADSLKFRAAREMLASKSVFAGNPMYHYTLGYLAAKTGENPFPFLDKARSCVLEGVMPHGAFNRKVLEFAVGQEPGDPSALYLLGLLYLSNERASDAVRLLEKASGLEGHGALNAIALYLAYRKENRPPADLERCLKEALELKPGFQYAALELSNLYLRLGRPADERLALLLTAAKAAANLASEELETAVILTLAEMGDDSAAAARMKNREFHTWEGGSGMRPLWWNVHLLWARALLREKKYDEALDKVNLSLAFPPGLNAGESDFGLEGWETPYWKGRILKAMGDKAAASEAFAQSAGWQPDGAGNAGDAEPIRTYHRIFGLLSCRELEDTTGAALILSEYGLSFEKGGLDPLAEVLYFDLTNRKKEAVEKARILLSSVRPGIERLILKAYLTNK